MLIDLFSIIIGFRGIWRYGQKDAVNYSFIYIYIYICIYVCVCVYIYTHTHIHTYIHMYLYMYFFNVLLTCIVIYPYNMNQQDALISINLF